MFTYYFVRPCVGFVCCVVNVEGVVVDWVVGASVVGVDGVVVCIVVLVTCVVGVAVVVGWLVVTVSTDFDLEL